MIINEYNGDAELDTEGMSNNSIFIAVLVKDKNGNDGKFIDIININKDIDVKDFENKNFVVDVRIMERKDKSIESKD